MAIGTPFPSKDATIEVATEVAPTTWKQVTGMKTWSVDGNDDISETDVFMQADPIENYGREKMTFSVQGLLTTTDDGQGIIQAAVAGRLTLRVRVKWDGTNGFSAQARPKSRRGNGTAGNGFAEVQFDFNITPSTVAAVGAGPVI